MNVLKDCSACSKGNGYKQEGLEYQLGGYCRKPTKSSQIAKQGSATGDEQKSDGFEKCTGHYEEDRVQDDAQVMGLGC